MIGVSGIALLLFIFTPSYGQSADDAQEIELLESCKILSLSGPDCRCIIGLSDKIGDGNLTGRIVLGILRRDKKYLSDISNQAENSIYYGAGSVLTPEDKRALFKDRMGRFGVSLKRVCDIDIKELAKITP
jgi:hypothetical protein